MEVTRRHNMTKGQARGWIDNKTPDLLTETIEDAKHEWSGDLLQFLGMKSRVSVTGSLSVTETDFVLNLSLPGLAKFFEGRARGCDRTLAAREPPR